MSEAFVSIIMRSYNEGWALRETLSALRAQDYHPWELIVIDSGSTDGSVDLIRSAQPSHFIQIRPQEYNPGRVMNHGLRLARSDYGVFLNADATPQGPHWLRPLVTALLDPQVAAVFSRQIPRPGCRAVFACDYERCFGPRRESARWDHFFSMVSSGLRKDVWAKRGFRENLQYAEDDEYTRWCKAEGYRVAFCPESVVMHSHNYTGRQSFRRSFGDARAQAACWTRPPHTASFWKTVLLGCLGNLSKDLVFCLRQGRWHEIPHAAWIRWNQRRGQLAGLRAGWRDHQDSQLPTRPPLPSHESDG